MHSVVCIILGLVPHFSSLVLLTQVIRNVKKLNQEKGFSMAVMMDTEGSEVHMGDIGEPRKAEVRPQFLIKVDTNKGLGLYCKLLRCSPTHLLFWE
jgi:hypothetical protein